MPELSTGAIRAFGKFRTPLVFFWRCWFLRLRSWDLYSMSKFRGNRGWNRFTRLFGLAMGCLALANCANGNVSSRDASSIRMTTAADTKHVVDSNDNVAIVGRRPPGCPHSFCGCEASLYVFGHIRPELNLASNWINKFQRTLPAPGMAAVRNHHVMVLMSHVGDSNWLVHDGNSGTSSTREHVRSIRGYIVVNPQGQLTQAMAK